MDISLGIYYVYFGSWYPFSLFLALTGDVIVPKE